MRAPKKGEKGNKDSEIKTAAQIPDKEQQEDADAVQKTKKKKHKKSKNK
jgi:hypothetical protein